MWTSPTTNDKVYGILVRYEKFNFFEEIK
jgi:hypothetical protein